METIICDTSAFLYWRTPPIVHLLACAPEGDYTLRKLLNVNEIARLREEIVYASPLGQAFLHGPNRRHLGNTAKTVLEELPLMVAWADAPVNVLVTSSSQQSKSSLIVPRLWPQKMPYGSIVQVCNDISVACPELCLQQLAARLSLPKVIMLATELCGTFSVFEASPPLRSVLQRLWDLGKLPELGGWSPCVSASGRLTDLWNRPALTDPQTLQNFARQSESRRGRAKLEKAANLVVPQAASPLEARTGMLLGLPQSMGGEGLGGFSHNERILLSPNAKTLANRDCCYCDLYWADGLDLECQSIAYHDNRKSYLSDADRSAALETMGIRVLPVSSRQIATRQRLDALASTVAQMRGIELPKKTERQRQKTDLLIREVQEDWFDLPLC
jgi:hypothetical protein